MDEKRFGVKTHLIKELRRFQSSLKHKRKTMPFRADAYTTVNNGSPVSREIQAEQGRLSIIPSAYPLAFRPPRQNLEHIDYTTVRVKMDIGHYITIRFNSVDDKTRFATAMGDLNVSSSEEELSPPS